MQDTEPENDQSDCSRETKGQRRTTNSRSWQSHHHDSAAPRQHPLICTGAEPIHPVHGPPKLLTTEAIPRNEVTFVPFSRGFLLSTALLPTMSLSWIRAAAFRNIRNLNNSSSFNVVHYDGFPTIFCCTGSRTRSNTIVVVARVTGRAATGKPGAEFAKWTQTAQDQLVL